MVKNKTILWGLTGGISIYKTLDVMSYLKKQGYNIQVIMTKNAQKFVSPLTFETITNNPVYSDTFDKALLHTQLAEEAEFLVIAPASYNIVGKIANGIADDLLTTITAAFRKSKIIAPAMNHYMYENSIFTDNIEKLKIHNFHIIEPDFGDLACGYVGSGRLRNLNDLTRLIIHHDKWTNPFLIDKFKGKKVIVTAGGTFEMIDPVRYIGNISSGKMGIALANALNDIGAEVTLVYANISEPLGDFNNGIKKIAVMNAREMESTLKELIGNQDLLFMASAVSDYRAKNYQDKKIKKSSDDFSIELIQNPDILKSLSLQKKDSQIFIGFAAESHNIEEYALTKLNKKKLGLIVANDISRKDIAFNSDDNEAQLFFSDSSHEIIKKKDKYSFSFELLNKIAIKLLP